MITVRQEILNVIRKGAIASLVWLEDPKILNERGRFVFWQYEYSVSTPILAPLPSVRLCLAEFRMLYRGKKSKSLN